MKKAIVLFSFLISSIFLFGQNVKTIEVVVTDSIELEGKAFNYFIMTFDQSMEYEMLENEKEFGSYQMIKKDDLIKEIKKAGIQIIEKEKSPTLTPEAIGYNMINVKFMSKKQMYDFVEKMKVYQNIQGFLTSIDAGDTSNAEEKLDKRIISKGQEKAKKMASYFGKEIGEIIEVSEFAPMQNQQHASHTIGLNDVPGWTSYIPNNAMNTYGLDGMNTKLIYYKSIRLKFELK